MLVYTGFVSPASSWADSVSSWRGLTSCHSSSACKEQDQKSKSEGRSHRNTLRNQSGIKKNKKRGAVENSKIYQKSCNITTSAAVLLVPAEAFAELHLLLNLSTARRAIKIKNTIVNLHCLGDILWAAEFGSVLDAIDTKSKLDAIRVSLGALWSLSNLQDFAMRIDAIRFVACIGFLPLNVLTAPASIWPWDRIRGEEPRGTDLMGQGHYRWLA